MTPADPRIATLNAAAKKEAAKIIARGGDIGKSAALAKALAKVNDASEEVNGLVYGAAWEALEAGRIVGVVGGDHATPYGSIQAHAERHPGLGILHVDAHADLRVAYEGFTWSHASIMHNVMDRIPQVARLVQVGIRDVCADEMAAVAASNGRIVTHTDAAVSDLRLRGASFASIAAASWPTSRRRSICPSTSTVSTR
jgi:agmatinase